MSVVHDAKAVENVKVSLLFGEPDGVLRELQERVVLAKAVIVEVCDLKK